MVPGLPFIPPPVLRTDALSSTHTHRLTKVASLVATRCHPPICRGTIGGGTTPARPAQTRWARTPRPRRTRGSPRRTAQSARLPRCSSERPPSRPRKGHPDARCQRLRPINGRPSVKASSAARAPPARRACPPLSGALHFRKLHFRKMHFLRLVRRREGLPSPQLT